MIVLRPNKGLRGLEMVEQTKPNILPVVNAPDHLEIEFEMIRRIYDRKYVGFGLFYHFKAAQSLIWPEDDHHRWSDLILKEYLDNRITVICGSRDSGKTRGISKAALIDYYVYPDETLILMTSTTLRGLELRVW